MCFISPHPVSSKSCPVSRVLGFGGAVLLVALLPAAWGNGFDLSWFTVYPGGDEGTGGRYSVTAVVGQPAASSSMEGSRYALTGGFLVPLSPDPTPTPKPVDYWLAY